MWPKSTIISALILIFLPLGGKAFGYYDEGIKQRIVPQGEIANGSKKMGQGIVMLFDKHKNRNIFVKIGEAIPGTSFRVIRVERNSVIVSNGGSEVKLVKDKFLSESGRGSAGRSYGSAPQQYAGKSPSYSDDDDDSWNTPSTNDPYSSARPSYTPPLEVSDNAPPAAIPPPPSYDPGYNLNSSLPAPAPMDNGDFEYDP